MEENNVLIPKGWERVKFSEYISFQEGPGLMSFLFREIGFPFINIRCIENGNINKESCQFLSEEIAQNQYKHFQLEENDLIVSTSGTLGKKAFVKKSDLPLLLNTSIIRFKPKDTDVMSLNFLNFLLEDNSFLYNLYSQSTGSAQVNVGPTHLKKLFITIPKTSKEQNKIAEILSKVDNAISETEIIIAKYNRIKTGLIQDLLTKGIDEKGNIRSEELHEFKNSPLGRIPNQWEVEKLGNLTLKIGDGTHSSVVFSDDDIVPFLFVSCIKPNKIDWSKKTSISLNEYNKISKGKEPKDGTVLYSLVGSYGNAVKLNSNERLSFQRHIGFIETKRDILMPEFLTLFLNSGFGKMQADDLAVGNAQKTITLGALSEFKIIKPSVDEQKEIIERNNFLEKQISNFKKSLTKHQSIKTGLMQDLLSGKKRVTHLIN